VDAAQHGEEAPVGKAQRCPEPAADLPVLHHGGARGAGVLRGLRQHDRAAVDEDTGADGGGPAQPVTDGQVAGRVLGGDDEPAVADDLSDHARREPGRRLHVADHLRGSLREQRESPVIG
jgi:hypothetical protein